MGREESQGFVSIVKNHLVGHNFKHFKGSIYHVDAIGVHSETAEVLVIYHNVEDESKVWVRPYYMFVSDVDHEKYPDVKQRFRFELVD